MPHTIQDDRVELRSSLWADWRYWWFPLALFTMLAAMTLWDGHLSWKSIALTLGMPAWLCFVLLVLFLFQSTATLVINRRGFTYRRTSQRVPVFIEWNMIDAIWPQDGWKIRTKDGQNHHIHKMGWTKDDLALIDEAMWRYKYRLPSDRVKEPIGAARLPVTLSGEPLAQSATPSRAEPPLPFVTPTLNTYEPEHNPLSLVVLALYAALVGVVLHKWAPLYSDGSWITTAMAIVFTLFMAAALGTGVFVLLRTVRRITFRPEGITLERFVAPPKLISYRDLDTVPGSLLVTTTGTFFLGRRNPEVFWQLLHHHHPRLHGV